MKLFVKRNLKKILTITLALVILASVCVAGMMTSNASGSGAGLAEWALGAYNDHWQYVWGGSSPGAVDCSGLIYSYCGGARTDLEQYATEIGYVSSGVPRVHGLGLHQPGHYGVYVGDGMAVDARGDEYGVCYESVATKSWVEWFKVGACNYITNGWEQFNGNYYYYENGEYVVSTSREIGGVTYNFNGSGVSDKTPEDMNAVANSSGGAVKKSTSSASKPAKSSSVSTSSNTDTSSNTNTTSAAPKSKTLKVGSQGGKVTKLQERLAELGFYNGEITGYFGEQTEKAYKKFQKAAGLTPDGIAGEDEQNTLYSDEAPTAVTEDNDKTEKEKETKTEKSGKFSVGSQGDKVSAIQQKLTELGYYNAEVTGYFGEVTEQAVKDFQTVNGLEATGILDKDTYELLMSENAIANTVEEETEPETETEPEVEETEPVEEEQYEEEADYEPETEAVTEPVQQAEKVDTITDVAEDNLAVAQKVVVKTNRLTKNALKSYDNDTADVTKSVQKNAGFIVWLLVVLAIAAIVTGVMFLMSKRNAAYSGARVKGAKKKPEVPVRYW